MAGIWVAWPDDMLRIPALLSLVVLSGCYLAMPTVADVSKKNTKPTPPDEPTSLEIAARLRASREFECPPTDVTFNARQDLGPDTGEVKGCGHEALYTCPGAEYYAGSPIVTPFHSPRRAVVMRTCVRDEYEVSL
jgi:hypothetical protein